MDSPTKEEKPLTIDKAAFLLLRVRRVFKKKVQLKKEKKSNAGPRAKAILSRHELDRPRSLRPVNNVAQDVGLPKSLDLNQINLIKPNRKSRMPPLIRSRTVPAIIVPFSILQAQLVKTAPSTSITPAPHHPLHKDVHGKSDYSTPGVDFVQFLTGQTDSVTSCHSASVPPSQHHRNSVQGHLSHSSRDSISGSSVGSHTDSSWTAVLPPSSKLLSSSDRSLSISSTDGNNLPTLLRANAPSSHIYSQSKAFGRFVRLLNAPAEERRKSSTISLQHYHLTQSSQSHHQQQDSYCIQGVESGRWSSFATPRPIRRRRSLEAEDIGRPRAVSIDSLLKTNFLQPDVASKHYSLAKRLSAGSASHAKIDYNRCNQELVAAVEHGNVEMVKSILDSSDMDVNSLNISGFSLLNIAVIQRHAQIAKILLAHGATDCENQNCKEVSGERLDTLIQEAEKKSEDLMAKLLKCSTFGNLSSALLKELEIEYHLWEKKYKKFRKLQSDYAKIDTPQPPTVLNVDVISSTAVRLRFQEADNPSNSICTKYKVEWSTEDTFLQPTIKYMEIIDLRKLETVLHGLETDRRYYFRVSAGNCKGYGRYQNSVPQSVVPSSWRDLDGKTTRYSGKTTVFDTIFVEIQQSRPKYASEIKSSGFRSPEIQGPGKDISTSIPSTQCCPESYRTQPSSNENPNSFHSHYPTPAISAQHQKKNQKIISIKQLFAAAPKFQKHFKRGIFLSCVIYSEDKLLVTNEEFLPTIEIDETFPGSLHNDFHWLLKVSTTWEDVKSFKADMEKSGSASTFHFRLKLLRASAAMQNALGIVDLGRLYYKTTRDKGNTVVIITTINYLRSTKLISSLNVRWIPLTKMTSRKSTEDISDALVNSIQDQILYHQVSNIPVGRGLYLGYLKLASSVNLLKILVAEKTPNMLPHAKIRDNPHVSGEEWKMIQKLAKSKCLDVLNNCDGGGCTGADGNLIKTLYVEDRGSSGGPAISATDKQTLQSSQCSAVSSEDSLSHAQDLFRKQIITALKRLFAVLEIDYENSKNHRLYNAEVIEVSSSVSLLVVVPSLENVCLVAGQSDKLLQRHDLIPLPIQVFEMIHLSTYQKEFITRYARLSAILEMDTILAQHTQREAFSSLEIASAKSRMNQLQDLQVKLDSAWKVSRWVIDVVTNSRDKSFDSASVAALVHADVKTSSLETILLDKHSDRSDEHHLGKVFSKSDQQLSVSPGIKFSRSENHLSNFGCLAACAPNRESSSENSENARLRYNAQATRKVSVPSPSEANGALIQAKVQFSPNIYSSHSQSDSTISRSVLLADTKASETISSSSLHNLFSQSSTPSCLCTSAAPRAEPSSSSSSTPSIQPVTRINRIARKNQGKIKTEPPPVPPRRNNALPATITPQRLPGGASVFNSPPALRSNPTPQNIPFVTVNVFDCSDQSSQESATTGSRASSSSVDESGLVESVQSPSNSSSVRIQVYAAYDCGLSQGTSVKMQINSQTTARQVVDLLVKQLNAEVKAKGLDKPVYERTQDFCLVSVVGARERSLRNDFKPLLLQQPWKTGRLYVRKKSEVLAGIEHNNRENDSWATT